VKPANILIERSGADGLGHVYLADFGLMKHSMSHSGLTNTGSFLGTVSYISPEQILQTDVDGRSDIYSLGCVLYESLTGRVPFTRETDWSIIHAHLHDMPPAPSEVHTKLPKALDGVVLRAMAKSPLDRYATCLEFAEATREALSRSPTSTLSAPTIVEGEIEGVDTASRGAIARPTPVPIVTDTGRDVGLVQPSTFVEPDARPVSAHPADAGMIVSPAPAHSTASGQLPPAQAAASSVEHPILPPSPPPPTGAAGGQPRNWAVIVSVSLVAILAGISGYLLATRNSGHTTNAATATSSNGAHSQPKSSMPTIRQMNIAATFHAIPKVGSACQGSDPISCTDLPTIFAPQGPATASTLTVQPLMTAYDRDNAYRTAFQIARSEDPKLGGSGSGRCTGSRWEHEDFWFHQPEHQSIADPAHSSDGNVFCYIDQAGNAVIVWSQAVTAMRSSGADSEPFLATLVAATKTDAFRYFFYVHHHIMM
jgi:serine/threonine protein kinase